MYIIILHHKFIVSFVCWLVPAVYAKIVNKYEQLFPLIMRGCNIATYKANPQGTISQVSKFNLQLQLEPAPWRCSL